MTDLQPHIPFDCLLGGCARRRPQAMADTADCLSRAEALPTHPDFTLKNPNKMRSLVGAFAGNLR